MPPPHATLVPAREKDGVWGEPLAEETWQRSREGGVDTGVRRVGLGQAGAAGELNRAPCKSESVVKGAPVSSRGRGPSDAQRFVTGAGLQGFFQGGCFLFGVSLYKCKEGGPDMPWTVPHGARRRA